MVYDAKSKNHLIIKHNSLPFQKFISFCLIGTVVDNFHVIVRVIRHLFNNDTSTINITDQQ